MSGYIGLILRLYLYLYGKHTESVCMRLYACLYWLSMKPRQHGKESPGVGPEPLNL